MARIRSIKPELLEDERTARLPHFTWRLFVSSLLLADDYGNFRAAPERVRGAATWAHGDDTGAALKTLAEVGLLTLYTVDGQVYAHVNGWDKHQKVDHKGKPSCPPMPAETLARVSREITEGLAPDLDLIGGEKDLIGEDGRGDPPVHSAPVSPLPVERDFYKPRTCDGLLKLFGHRWAEKFGSNWHGRQMAAAAANKFMDRDAAGLVALAPLVDAAIVRFLADERPHYVQRGHAFDLFVKDFDAHANPSAPRGPPPRDVRVGHAMAEVKPRVAGKVNL